MQKLSEIQIRRYQKSGYKVVGKNKHTGVELCRWSKSRLRGERNCYKSVYGVDSHRCLQMTPSLNFCTLSCNFCWRNFHTDRKKSPQDWDSPKELVEELLAAQKKLLSGFGGNPKTSRKIYLESLEPKNFAISLDGEPALYPYLPQLIKEVQSRGISAFLVTNGTVPERLKEMLIQKIQPDNLYISVYATNSQDYKRMTGASEPQFKKILESLSLLKRFTKSRTIFRMTLVKEENMQNPEGFAKMAKESQPGFIEVKGYSWLGGSRQRLKITNMPRMHEIEGFTEKIAKAAGYIKKFSDEKSRVIILAKDEDTWRKSREILNSNQQ